MGVQVDGEEHVLGGQDGWAAKIMFYYTFLSCQSFIWTDFKLWTSHRSIMEYYCIYSIFCHPDTLGWQS